MVSMRHNVFRNRPNKIEIQADDLKRRGEGGLHLPGCMVIREYSLLLISMIDTKRQYLI